MPLLRRRSLLFAAVAAAAAAAGLWLGLRPRFSRPLEGVRFPDTEGRVRDLAEWRGKVLIVNFWATWCAPCREEIPILSEVRQAHAARGLEIVGIAIDNEAKIRDFAATFRISYPILIAEGAGLDLIRALGNTSGGLPFTVFFGRDGRPIRSKLGALSKSELESIVSELLG